MSKEGVDYQLTPQGKYSRNAVEKGVQTWKDHFAGGMSSTHPDFPVSQWCKLIEQANITLNLMRPSRINPQLSAYAQVFGQYNYQKTPMPPPGMKVLAHVLPQDRRSFDTHAIKAFFVGPAMEHYRCFKVHVPSTGGVRIADTVRWFPHNGLKMPIPSKDALLQATLDDLKAVLKSTVKNNILPPKGTDTRDVLIQLNEIFKNKDSKDPSPATPKQAGPTPAPTQTPPPLPRVKTLILPRLPRVEPKPMPTNIHKIHTAPKQCSTHTPTLTQSPTFQYANSLITLSQLETSYL